MPSPRQGCRYAGGFADVDFPASGLSPVVMSLNNSIPASIATTKSKPLAASRHQRHQLPGPGSEASHPQPAPKITAPRHQPPDQSDAGVQRKFIGSPLEGGCATPCAIASAQRPHQLATGMTSASDGSQASQTDRERPVTLAGLAMPAIDQPNTEQQRTAKAIQFCGMRQPPHRWRSRNTLHEAGTHKTTG